MALTINSDQMLIAEVRWLLNKYRFGFEKAEVTLEYFPIEDMQGIIAKGAYTLKFKILNEWRLPEYKRSVVRFYKEVGLIPVWRDPVC